MDVNSEDYTNLKPKDALTVEMKKMRLGEMMVLLGWIDHNQLEVALKRQSQVSEQIGSILLEMGFINIDDLLTFLSTYFEIPSINLFDINIDQQLLALIGTEKIREKHILPLFMKGNTLAVAMVNPKDVATLNELQFKLGKKIRPLVTPSFMMEAAINTMLKNPGKSIEGKEIEKFADIAKERIASAPKFMDMLKNLVKKGASDIFLLAGAPPSIRVASELQRMSLPILTPDECEAYAREMMTDAQWQEFLEKQEADFAVNYQDIGRFRVNVYRQRHSIAIAMRPIIESIPSLRELNLPAWIRDFVMQSQGLILVSGPAGHGKSTTLFAMVDMINSSKRCNIITLEDPVEYLHRHKKSNISQREVGVDTESFHTGLKGILRQSPDVIVVGEMRDKESFEIALRASYTGHLVIATMHSNNAIAAVENAIQMFEPHRQNLIRMMLSDALLISLSQRLVPLKGGGGRISCTGATYQYLSGPQPHTGRKSAPDPHHHADRDRGFYFHRHRPGRPLPFT